MSHNISASDSEDDDRSIRRRKSDTGHARVWKYECPPDFVHCTYNCDGAQPKKKKRNTELWLIKAPAHFDHNSLGDLKVSLSGLERIQSTGTSSKIYSVLASSSGPADLHLLTSGGESQDVSLSSSSFAGVLSISESYGDCSGNQTPIPVPAAPAPSIPAGLKQRFQPFGSSAPSHLIQNSTSTCHFSPKRELLVSEDPEGPRPKKKKKKKDKHGEEERIEVPCMKQENEPLFELEVTQTEEEGKAERKKKKKVKKEKVDTQDKLEIDASLIPKEEPMDTSYGDIDGSVKRKKKSKKKRHE